MRVIRGFWKPVTPRRRHDFFSRRAQNRDVLHQALAANPQMFRKIGPGERGLVRTHPFQNPASAPHRAGAFASSRNRFLSLCLHSVYFTSVLSDS